MGKLMIRNAGDSAWITIAGVGTVVQQDAEPSNPHAGMMWLDTDATSGLQSEIRDADGDTKIQCEESADEDIIRMDVAGSEVWNMSAAGERTMALQPAFNFQLDANMTNFALDQWVPLEFDLEVFDIGDNFASYTFTAPVTGKYLLTFILYLQALDTDAGFYACQILTSNRGYSNYLEPDAFDQDATYWPWAMSAVADMDVNDTAIVNIYQDVGAQQTDIVSISYFTGVLVA